MKLHIAWRRFRLGLKDILCQGDKLYLRRWEISTPWFGIYLHKFLESDLRVPHDHPWDFVSILLWGEYMEKSFGMGVNWNAEFGRRRGNLNKGTLNKGNNWFGKQSRDEIHRDGLDHPDQLILDGPIKQQVRRKIGSVMYRKAETPHYVILPQRKPAWTLILRGRHKRDWGFFPEDPKSGLGVWISHKDYQRPGVV